MAEETYKIAFHEGKKDNVHNDDVMCISNGYEISNFYRLSGNVRAASTRLFERGVEIPAEEFWLLLKFLAERHSK